MGKPDDVQNSFPLFISVLDSVFSFISPLLASLIHGFALFDDLSFVVFKHSLEILVLARYAMS